MSPATAQIAIETVHRNYLQREWRRDQATNMRWHHTNGLLEQIHQNRFTDWRPQKGCLRPLSDACRLFQNVAEISQHLTALVFTVTSLIRNDGDVP